MNLEQSIEQFKANPYDSKNRNTLLRLLVESEYFILLHPSALQKRTKNQIEKRVTKGIVEDLPLFAFYLNQEPFFPVFTSQKELSLFPGSVFYPSIRVSFESLYLLIKTYPTIQTILVNPEGELLAFERSQFLKSFSFTIGTLETSQLSSIDLRSLEQGREKVKGNLRKNFFKMVYRFPEIRKIWLLKEPLNEEGNFAWLLVIESDKENHEAHSNFLRLLSSPLGKVGMCYTSYESIRRVVRKFHPIYIRYSVLRSSNTDPEILKNLIPSEELKEDL